jgi:hypothetical protein
MSLQWNLLGMLHSGSFTWKAASRLGAMTTRPRFMRPHSIGPRLIGPNGSEVPYMMSPFVRFVPSLFYVF